VTVGDPKSVFQISLFSFLTSCTRANLSRQSLNSQVCFPRLASQLSFKRISASHFVLAHDLLGPEATFSITFTFITVETHKA
jgi:hypothetical protein